MRLTLVQFHVVKAIAIVSSVFIAAGLELGLKQAACAQVTPDSSLNTTVTSPDNLNFVIKGGDRAGHNLFHSFDEFSIPTNGSARFNNPNDITTIISRVTGGDRSIIDGVLQANGDADLFLLNPNGIVFNGNAQLDLGGSFIASTANALLFDDGHLFDTAATPPPLLSITSPVGLQLGTHPGTIRVNDHGQQIFTTLESPFLSLPLTPLPNPATLETTDGNTLALVGGHIRLTGSSLRTPNGRIALMSASDGIVPLQTTVGGWQLNPSNTVAHNGGSPDLNRTITLQHRAALDASGTTRSGIQLMGHTITVADGSVIGMRVQNRATSDLTLDSIAIEITGTDPHSALNSRVSMELLGEGDVGTMRIQAETLTIEDGGEIGIGILGTPAASHIQVNVADRILIRGAAPSKPHQFSRLGILTYGIGDAGNLNVSTRSLVLQDGGNMGSITALGTGAGGNVMVDATESVVIQGETPGIAIAGEPFPSTINTSTAGTGDAGNIVINTAHLRLSDAGDIVSVTLSTGNAGTITINAREQIELQSSGEFSTIGSDAFDFTALRAQLGLKELSGNGGSIAINTPLFSATGLSQIILDTAGTGTAGNLSLNADRIFLTDGASISAATASGEGGNLVLSGANSLVMGNGSQLSTMAGGSGNGGNITLSLPVIVGWDNSDIVASAIGGNGGNITINTQSLLGVEFGDRLTPNSDITASSEFGIDGTVAINNPEVDPSSQVFELPNTLVDVSQLVRPGCSLDEDQFVLAGRGGLPSSPFDLMDGDRPWTDIRDLSFFLNNESETVASSPVKQPVETSTLQEATGMAIAPNGTLQLIASGSQRAIISHPTCAS